MILAINEDYRIATDVYAWMIQQRRGRKRNGKQVEEWRAIKWYGTPQQGVQGLADLLIMASDALTHARNSEKQNPVGRTGLLVTSGRVSNSGNCYAKE